MCSSHRSPEIVFLHVKSKHSEVVKLLCAWFCHFMQPLNAVVPGGCVYITSILCVSRCPLWRYSIGGTSLELLVPTYRLFFYWRLDVLFLSSFASQVSIINVLVHSTPETDDLGVILPSDNASTFVITILIARSDFRTILRYAITQAPRSSPSTFLLCQLLSKHQTYTRSRSGSKDRNNIR